MLFFQKRRNKKVRLSGYGVELAIKSTEYKAQDDTKVKGNLFQNCVVMQQTFNYLKYWLDVDDILYIVYFYLLCSVSPKNVFKKATPSTF